MRDLPATTGDWTLWSRDRKAIKLVNPEDMPHQIFGSEFCGLNFQLFRSASDNPHGAATEFDAPLLLLSMSERPCSHVPSHPANPDGCLDIVNLALEMLFVAARWERFKELIETAASKEPELRVYEQIASKVNSPANVPC